MIRKLGDYVSFQFADWPPYVYTVGRVTAHVNSVGEPVPLAPGEQQYLRLSYGAPASLPACVAEAETAPVSSEFGQRWYGRRFRHINWSTVEAID